MVAYDRAGVSLLVASAVRRPELNHEDTTDRPTTLVWHAAPGVTVVQGVRVAVVGFEGVERIGRSQGDGRDGEMIGSKVDPDG